MFSSYFALAILAASAGYVGTSLTLVNIYYLRNMPDLPHQERSAVMKESLLTLALAALGFSISVLFLYLSLDNSGIRLGLLGWIPVCIAWIVISVFSFTASEDSDTDYSLTRNLMLSHLKLAYIILILFSIIFFLGIAHSVFGWP